LQVPLKTEYPGMQLVDNVEGEQDAAYRSTQPTQDPPLIMEAPGQVIQIV
jgi:hypothetical protein